MAERSAGVVEPRKAFVEAKDAFANFDIHKEAALMDNEFEIKPKVTLTPMGVMSVDQRDAVQEEFDYYAITHDLDINSPKVEELTDTAKRMRPLKIPKDPLPDTRVVVMRKGILPGPNC